MALSNYTIFNQRNPPSHIMITYNDENKLDVLTSIFINEGLKRNQLCIYAMRELNEEKMKKLSTTIIDYKENVTMGNLLILDLTPYLTSVLNHDLKPFEDLKKSVLEKVKERPDKHVRFCGNLVSFLFKNKHFEQCFLLEEWWQSNPLGGTALCHYQNSMFNEYPYSEQKERIFNTHNNIVYS